MNQKVSKMYSLLNLNSIFEFIFAENKSQHDCSVQINNPQICVSRFLFLSGTQIKFWLNDWNRCLLDITIACHKQQTAAKTDMCRIWLLSECSCCIQPSRQLPSQSRRYYQIAVICGFYLKNMYFSISIFPNFLAICFEIIVINFSLKILFCFLHKYATLTLEIASQKWIKCYKIRTNAEKNEEI